MEFVEVVGEIECGSELNHEGWRQTHIKMMKIFMNEIIISVCRFLTGVVAYKRFIFLKFSPPVSKCLI